MAATHVREILLAKFPELAVKYNNFHVAKDLPSLLEQAGETKLAEFFARYQKLLETLPHRDWHFRHQHARRLLRDEGYDIKHLEHYNVGVTGCSGSHCEHFFCVRQCEVTMILNDACTEFATCDLDQFEIWDDEVQRLRREMEERRKDEAEAKKRHERERVERCKDLKRARNRERKLELAGLKARAKYENRRR